MKILLRIFVVFLLVLVGGFIFLSLGLERGRELIINDVNLLLLTDGTYSGKHNAGRWSNEVSVIIKDHTITEINVVKDVTFPLADVTKELINRVLEKQSIQVDAISGATVTSKAYLKSIENALRK